MHTKCMVCGLDGCSLGLLLDVACRVQGGSAAADCWKPKVVVEAKGFWQLLLVLCPLTC